MRDALRKRTTFGQLQPRYDLKVDNAQRDDKSGFFAVSGKIPELVLSFERSSDAAEDTTATATAKLDELSGPASVMLPDYVGVAFEKIPGFLANRGYDGTINDSFGSYSVTQFGGFETLAADSTVVMFAP